MRSQKTRFPWDRFEANLFNLFEAEVAAREFAKNAPIVTGHPCGACSSFKNPGCEIFEETETLLGDDCVMFTRR